MDRMGLNHAMFNVAVSNAHCAFESAQTRFKELLSTLLSHMAATGEKIERGIGAYHLKKWINLSAWVTPPQHTPPPPPKKRKKHWQRQQQLLLCSLSLSLFACLCLKAASIKLAGSQHGLIISIQVSITLYRITARSGCDVMAARDGVRWNGRKQLQVPWWLWQKNRWEQKWRWEDLHLLCSSAQWNLIRSCVWCINFILEKLPWGLLVN